MIECIFTIDYEIYGNGEGSLAELVYEPAQELRRIFEKAGAKLVVFVEAAELEMISAAHTDAAIHDVQRQVREFYEQGFEIALHLHPQWYNARYRNRKWQLDYDEYNLCRLSRPRIEELVDRGIAYLRNMLASRVFTPLAFRAGNWLFQPTAAAAEVLVERGIKVDSSVFKGGLQHRHQLNYRPAIGNGFYWRFQRDVNKPDDNGALLEMPIYTQMVPFWQMLTAKRLALQRRSNTATQKTGGQAMGLGRKLGHLRDYLRFQYPLKLDFCRMKLEELTRMMEHVIRDDRETPTIFKPIVAIGHTKDLVEGGTIESFLAFLRNRSIATSTFKEAFSRCPSRPSASCRTQVPADLRNSLVAVEPCKS